MSDRPQRQTIAAKLAVAVDGQRRWMAQHATMFPDGVTLAWQGPFGWPGREQCGLGAVPDAAGVYLLCFPYAGGFLVYAAGVTSRPVATRLREHTREYVSGRYTILDPDAVASGVRTEIWHGWAEARRPEPVAEFAARRDELVCAAHRQLAAFRVFVAALPAEARLPNRVEAGIMNALYSAQPPFCDIPDRGMHLSRRRASEQPVRVHHRCSHTLHALPASMEV
jgi:hypothetical protein